MNAIEIIDEVPLAGYNNVYGWNFRGLAIRLTSVGKQKLSIGEGLSTMVYSNYNEISPKADGIQKSTDPECFACVTNTPHTASLHTNLVRTRPMGGFPLGNGIGKYWMFMRWVTALPIHWDNGTESFRESSMDSTKLVNRISNPDIELCTLCNLRKRHSVQLHGELLRWN